MTTKLTVVRSFEMRVQCVVGSCAVRLDARPRSRFAVQSARAAHRGSRRATQHALRVARQLDCFAIALTRHTTMRKKPRATGGAAARGDESGSHRSRLGKRVVRGSRAFVMADSIDGLPRTTPARACGSGVENSAKPRRDDARGTTCGRMRVRRGLVRTVDRELRSSASPYICASGRDAPSSRFPEVIARRAGLAWPRARPTSPNRELRVRERALRTRTHSRVG